MASSPDAVAYVETNVGVVPNTVSPNGLQAIFVNVGVLSTLAASAALYVDQNLGVYFAPTNNNASYINEGDVDDSTPTPHIWWITPTSGRSGDGISIIGHGFGATQAEYDGLAQWRPDFSADDWTNLGITGWVRVAANGDAYGANRTMDPVAGRIDAEHGQIDFVIPEPMQEPGHQLRVVTDGE